MFGYHGLVRWLTGEDTGQTCGLLGSSAGRGHYDGAWNRPCCCDQACRGRGGVRCLFPSFSLRRRMLTSILFFCSANLLNLRDQAITSTYQLIGKFLTFKGKGVDSQTQCNAMWFWLQGRGVNSFRAGIVHCIAERCNLMMPGIYELNEAAKEEATAATKADA